MWRNLVKGNWLKTNQFVWPGFWTRRLGSRELAIRSDISPSILENYKHQPWEIGSGKKHKESTAAQATSLSSSTRWAPFPLRARPHNSLFSSECSHLSPYSRFSSAACGATVSLNRACEAVASRPLGVCQCLQCLSFWLTCRSHSSIWSN